MREVTMTKAHCIIALACVSVASGAAIACGSDDGSTFNESNGGGDGGDGGLGADTGGFSSDPVGTNAACVTALKNAALPAVNLIQMYDKSGSMGDPAEGGDPNARWIP